MAVERLRAFLYLLMRDVVVPGEVERLVIEAEKVRVAIYSNGHLASYAEELVGRLVHEAHGIPPPGSVAILASTEAS